MKWHRGDGARLMRNFIVSCQGRKPHCGGTFSLGPFVRMVQQKDK